MRQVHVVMLSTLLVLCSLSSQAQQSVPSATDKIVPPLVKFSGTVTDVNGKPLTGTVGVTFSLYKDEQGGAPLWVETQNVQPNKTGHYSVMLGSTSSQGIPNYVFVTGDARWLGVQPEGQAEQPRVLLLSVPYALKAGDAETVGGLPPSAFMLAAPPTLPASTISAVSASSQAPTAAPPAVGTTPVTTAGGTINKLAKFDAAADITNSLIFDNGTNVGIGNTAPAAKLDVSGGATVRGLLYLPATGTATSTAGKNSQAINLAASAFNSGIGAAVNQNFRWQAEPVGNNTASTSGTLNLLYAAGSNPLAETGLKVGSTGRITFATGQTFPGTGTVTGVTAGTDLTGGGTSGTVTLNLDTTKVPQLATNNSFTGNQTVNGNVSVVGGHVSVGGSRALSCTRSCGAIGSIPNTGISTYSTGSVAAPAGYSLTGCSAYWASSTSCGIIQYPATANITALDDGAGACHALGYNGSGGTLASCACVTACELP